MDFSDLFGNIGITGIPYQKAGRTVTSLPQKLVLP